MLKRMNKYISVNHDEEEDKQIDKINIENKKKRAALETTEEAENIQIEINEEPVPENER
jgi:hypothetical protein